MCIHKIWFLVWVNHCMLCKILGPGYNQAYFLKTEYYLETILRCDTTTLVTSWQLQTVTQCNCMDMIFDLEQNCSQTYLFYFIVLSSSRCHHSSSLIPDFCTYPHHHVDMHQPHHEHFICCLVSSVLLFCLSHLICMRMHLEEQLCVFPFR